MNKKSLVGLSLAVIGIDIFILYFLFQPVPHIPEEVQEVKIVTRLVDLEAPSSTSELISPDGEWLLGVKSLGQQPFARSDYYFIELTNLHDGTYHLIPVDYSVRPEDSGNRDIQPIGWSSDGRIAYIGKFDKYDTTGNPLLRGYWKYPNWVRGIKMEWEGKAPEFKIIYGIGGQVLPYKGYPNVEYTPGSIVDFFPRVNRALWYENSDINGPATSTLFFFEPDSLNKWIVAQWGPEDLRTITSASVDANLKEIDVAYVVHEKGKNDTAFLFRSTSTTPAETDQVDPAAYHKKLMDHGLTQPYTFIVEKTRSYIILDDLFLLVQGANGKITFLQCGKWDSAKRTVGDTWSCFAHDKGWL